MRNSVGFMCDYPPTHPHGLKNVWLCRFESYITKCFKIFQFGFASNWALNREAGCTRRLRGAGLPLVLLLPNGHGSPSDVCYASGTEAIYRVL